VRKGIHPDYVEAKVVCSCGNKFTTCSTSPELHVELCNQCHPFYTGQQKFVDTGGRVQRFSDKFGNAAQAALDKEAAVKQARVKAAEESAEIARKAREIKDAEKAKSAAKHEVAEAVSSGVAAADVTESVEEAPAEDVVEETVEETAEEVAEETAEESAE
jgi:large subunit ribosomal protein L31